MKKNESITTIMTTDVYTIHQGDPVSSIRNLFDEHQVHHLPVVDGDKLIGIFTWNDFMRITFGDFPEEDMTSLDLMLDNNYELEDVMRTNPVTVSTKSTIADAAKILGVGEFHSLPVVDGDLLVGIVTSSDLIRYLADMF